MSIIIDNALDNAVETCKRQSDGRLLTTKVDSSNHGLGLKNIEVCAKKYYGKAETTVKDGEFELVVMLQKRISE